MTQAQPLLMIIDDEPRVAALIKGIALAAGFRAVTPGAGRDALNQLDTVKPDVALVDLKMPEVDGLQVLRVLKARVPNCQVILMTGHASVETAVESIKLGARDYLCKPFDLSRLKALLASVRDDFDRRRSLLAAEHDIAKRLEFEGMIGRSALMQELFALIRRLAPHVRTALVTGETGTGKELVARALHRLGPRTGRPFVVINCSAVVEPLFESELFGHARGAFTGATEAKRGIFEAADGGTLFLDEIGELPRAVQAKLLRVVETGEVQPVGSLHPRRVDVCVIGATNRDLRAEAESGRFRADLYYRLNTVELTLPPLRERRDDIPYLTAAFVREFATRFERPVEGVNPDAERLLCSAVWPGNVRELRNVLERACLLASGAFLTELDVRQCLPNPPPPGAGLHTEDQSGLGDLLESSERQHIQRVLARVHGNKAAAARLLGISRRGLYRRLQRLGLSTGTGRP